MLKKIFINVILAKISRFFILFFFFPISPNISFSAAIGFGPTSLDVDVGNIQPGTISSDIRLVQTTGFVNIRSGDAIAEQGTAILGQVNITGDPNAEIRFRLRNTGGGAINGSNPLNLGSGILVTRIRDTHTNAVLLDSGGNLQIDLGADVTIPAAVATGLYTGQFIAQTRYPGDSWLTGPTLNISLNIVNTIPLSGFFDRDMQFGTIIVDPNGGTVRLNGGGMANITGTSEFLDSNLRGRFRVSGDVGSTVEFSIADSVLTGPGNDIILSNYNGTSSPLTLTDGTGTINIGGRLTFGANQTAGNYSGTYTLTFNYQ